jgi:Amt family ammonium transporter
LVNGIWGTLAAGLFGTGATLWPQLVGIVAVGTFCLGFATLLFLGLQRFVGLRVHPFEEQRGLDLSEHGMEAYAGFQIFRNQ